MTDSLAMQAITDVYTPGQAAVKALQAGADLLLMPNGLADAYTAVLEAVQDGTIPSRDWTKACSAFCSAKPIRHPDAVTRCRL